MIEVGSVATDVLITGGMGIVGSNLARHFIDEGHNVCIFDIKARKIDYLDEVTKNWKYYYGSVIDLQALEATVKKEKPTAIINSAIGGDLAGTYNTFEMSVRGTACVLEVARRFDLYVVAVSTGAVYGQLDGDGPISENQPFGPSFPLREYDSVWATEYCVSKRMVEHWAQLYRDLYSLRVAVPRLGWVYGPGEMSSELNIGITLMLRKAIAGEPLQLPYGRDHFCNFVYTKDVCDAIYKSVTSHKSLTFNVSYDRGYFMKEACEAVMRTIPGSRIELGQGLWPSKGVAIPRGANPFLWPPNRHLDNSLAKVELGYRPAYNIDRGVTEYARWMKRNWHSCSPQAVPFPC